MAKKQVEDIKDSITGVVRDPDKRGALWIHTGSTVMDLVVGAGRGLGYETGEVVLIEAQSGAGKSFFSHEAVANAFHQYKNLYPGKFKHQYQDVESGITFDSKELFGMEIMPYDQDKRVRPKTIQDCFAENMLFVDSLGKDKYGVLVTDSINGLFDQSGQKRADAQVSSYVRGKDYEEKTMGMEMAKYLSQTFFKAINPKIEESNCLYLIVAQYRQKSLPSGGVYYDLQMGEALKYYANKRVKITVAEDITVKGRQIGAVLKVETKKARGPWPYRKCFVTLWYTTGIDNVTSNLDYLYGWRTATGELAKVAEKKVKWDEDSEELSRDDMVFFIEKNNLEEELAQRVIAKWKAEEEDAIKGLQGRKKRFGNGE